MIPTARLRGCCRHFTVYGTLLEACASLKSFRPKSERPRDRRPPDDTGNPTVNFHKEARRRDPHRAGTADGPEGAVVDGLHVRQLGHRADVRMLNTSTTTAAKRSQRRCHVDRSDPLTAGLHPPAHPVAVGTTGDVQHPPSLRGDHSCGM